SLQTTLAQHAPGKASARIPPPAVCASGQRETAGRRAQAGPDGSSSEGDHDEVGEVLRACLHELDDHEVAGVDVGKPDRHLLEGPPEVFRLLVALGHEPLSPSDAATPVSQPFTF